MSYILEALKRADAERERGAVPNLHSHATPAAAATVQRPSTRLWIGALAALVLLLVAALGWALMRPSTPPAAVPPVAAPAAVLPPVAAVVPPPAATAPASPPPIQRAAPAAQKPAAVARTAPASAARATPPRPAVSAVAAPAPAKPQSTAETRVYSIAELPEDVRQQLPKLAINGGTYSVQAAYRMLIVNGQVLHENDEPVPGLTLETIRPKDVVLRFRGYRYSVGY